MMFAERAPTEMTGGQNTNFQARQVEAELRLAITAIRTPALLSEVHDQIMRANRSIGVGELGVLTTYRLLRRSEPDKLRDFAAKAIGWILTSADSERAGRERVLGVNPFLRRYAEQTVENLANKERLNGAKAVLGIG